MILVLIVNGGLGWFVPRTRLRQAEAAYLNASLTREVAEIAVAEFATAVTVREDQEVRREVDSAEEGLERLEGQPDGSRQ